MWAMGHIISIQGVVTDEEKISVIKMAHPTIITEVWSFLAFTLYYHEFVPQHVQINWPLHTWTSGRNVGKKRAAITWDNRCQQSFDELKFLCTTTPILGYADFTRPFKLHTDACRSSLGTLLYQAQHGGTNAIISYVSRSLTKAETHYPAHKLEFLTLTWVVVEKLHEYL